MREGESERFIVYEVRFPDGSVYVGRTSSTLKQRRTRHLYRAKSGSQYPVHAALRQFGDGEWRVLWEGEHFYRSLAEEVKAIARARRIERFPLNLTRGGFYDSGGLMKRRRAKKHDRASAGTP